MRIAIFSAFPHEIKQTIKKLKPFESLIRYPLTVYLAEFSAREIIIAQAGMGSLNAEAALKYVIEEHAPDFILSIGFGGALYNNARAGDLISAGKVFLIPEKAYEQSLAAFDPGEFPSLEIPDAGEIFGKLSENINLHKGCILTFEKRKKKSEVRTILPEGLPFPVCDMETFFLAKISIERGLPFFAVRSISDLRDEEIPPEFFSVTDEAGKYRLSNAIGLILSRPKLIPDIVTIGRNSYTASTNLWHFVKALINIL